MGIIPPFRRYCKGFSPENGTIFFACPGKNPTICRKAPFQGLKTSRTRLVIARNAAQFSGSSEKHRKTHWCGSTQRLPCVKGAGKNLRFLTEGLSNCINESTQKEESSDPLSPSVRTGAAPLGQQGEPLRLAGSSRNIREIATPVLRHWFAMTCAIQWLFDSLTKAGAAAPAFGIEIRPLRPRASCRPGTASQTRYLPAGYRPRR